MSLADWREGKGRERWLLAGFALAHVVLFGVVFQTIYWLGYSDIPIYHADASRIVHGLVPYRDFVLEYPPLAAAVFTLPRFVGASFLAYYRAFTVELIVCDLVVLATLHRIARDRGEHPGKVLALYTAFTITLGPILSQEFDLAPAAMTIVALWLATRRRDVPAWALLALGVLTKLYPLLIAPVFLLGDLRRRDWRRIGAAALTGVVTVVVVMLPLLVVAPTAVTSFFAYHAKRGIQIESTYGGLLLAASKLGYARVGIGWSYGSWNVTGAGLGPIISFSTLALAAGVCAAWLFLFATARRMPDDAERDAAWLASAALLVLLATIVTSKVLSPQYLVWALPFVPLVRGPGRRAIWGLYALIGITTFYIFPSNYGRLVPGANGGVITVLVIRNALLLALTLVVASSLRAGAAPSARLNADAIPA